MSTEQHGSAHRLSLRKECPACGQAIGWMRFLCWSLAPTGWTRLHCPGCQTRLKLRSSVSTVLLACLIIALLMLGFFLPLYLPIPRPFVVIGGVLGLVIELLVLVFVLTLLFNILFVSVKLQDEKA